MTSSEVTLSLSTPRYFLIVSTIYHVVCPPRAVLDSEMDFEMPQPVADSLVTEISFVF